MSAAKVSQVIVRETISVVLMRSLARNLGLYITDNLRRMTTRPFAILGPIHARLKNKSDGRMRSKEKI